MLILARSAAAATLLAMSQLRCPMSSICASAAGDDVRRSLEARIHLEPKSANLHFELAACHMANGATKAAAHAMRASLEINPDNLLAQEACSSIGDQLYEDGEIEEAASCWRLLHEMDGNNDPDPAVAERLATALQRLGRLQESAELLLKLLESPQLRSSAQTRAWIYIDLGALLERIAPIPGAGPEWPSPQAQTPGAAVDGVPKVRIGGNKEPLSALDCYRRAISLAPTNGQAHKSLADALVIAGGAGAALADFQRAAALMPDDICCVTHCAYGAPTHERPAAPLNLDDTSSADAFTGAGAMRSLGAVTAARAPIAATATTAAEDASTCADDEDGWAAETARLFETHGVVVIPNLLEEAAVEALMDAISRVRSDEGARDFRRETREAQARDHRALRLLRSADGGTVLAPGADALSTALAKVYPLLRRVLQVDDGKTMPLLGSGFMCVAEGAAAQELHKDVHGHDRHTEDRCAQGGPRAVSIQLQLTDTTASARSMGSLEVLPGSHRPDALNGSPERIRRALDSPDDPACGIVPIAVPSGTVTIYSSRAWHRGGASQSAQERVFCFLTVMEPDAPSAPGLIHTMELDDVGAWVVGQDGLKRADE